MKRVILWSVILIIIAIQWHAHYLKNEVSWIDFVSAMVAILFLNYYVFSTE